MPYDFVKEYYVPYSDYRYRFIASLTDLVDEHLKEKYWEPEGYCFLNEGTLSTIQWAFEAFDGTNREMIAFLRMHGHVFSYVENSDEYVAIKARAEELNMAEWPQEGAIMLKDGYVIVNL